MMRATLPTPALPTDRERHAASCDALLLQLATASPAAVPALAAVYDVHAAACGRLPFTCDLA